MMRLTFLMLFGNAIFYLIQAVSCCRILTRRFSWPVMVLGFASAICWLCSRRSRFRRRG